MGTEQCDTSNIWLVFGDMLLVRGHVFLEFAVMGLKWPELIWVQL